MLWDSGVIHSDDSVNIRYGGLELKSAEDTFATDNNWKFDKSPAVYSELYHGEVYDARLEQDGWDSAGFDDKS